jgi:photosystem I subunit 3
MKRIFVLIFAIFIWFSAVSPALAENTTLVPCYKSAAFVERMKNAPDSYYTTEPLKAYSQLLCGEDGLPHITLDRLSLAVDVAIPIAIFLYTAGFIGWSGRSYLQAIKKQGAAEEKEMFIDVPLFIGCMLISLLWPVAAIKELLAGELVAKDEEIPISVR